MYSGQLMQAPSAKCCGCISLRLGCGIICLIWAAFSMYMAVLSFQSSSLFYSYMTSAATTVFGVANLILSLVSVAGLAILATDIKLYVYKFSHAVFVCVFLVLVDTFVNVILFITSKIDYYNWCISTSSNDIIQNMNTTLDGTVPQFDFAQDFYNCHSLWEDELKFGIIFFILMLAFYVYWALRIYRYSLYRRLILKDSDLYDRAGNPAMMGGPGVAMPANAMINGGGGAGGVPFPANDQSIIVLNNAKPRTKSTDTPKRRIDTFSFKNIKKSIAPSSMIVPLQQRQMDQLQIPFIDNKRGDSQFTIGFRLGPEGNIIDIENAPSPTPTFTEQNAKEPQVKRKQVKEDNNFDESYY